MFPGLHIWLKKTKQTNKPNLTQIQNPKHRSKTTSLALKWQKRWEGSGRELNAVLTGHPMTQIKISQGKASTASPTPAPQEQVTGLCLAQINFHFSSGNSGHVKEYSFNPSSTLPAMDLLLVSQTSLIPLKSLATEVMQFQQFQIPY